jgi:lactate permease
MICVHNVVAAGAVVGMLGREGEIVRKTLIPMVYYVIQAGLIGQALITGAAGWWLAAAVFLVVAIGGLSLSRGRPMSPAMA